MPSASGSGAAWVLLCTGGPHHEPADAHDDREGRDYLAAARGLAEEADADEQQRDDADRERRLDDRDRDQRQRRGLRGPAASTQPVPPSQRRRVARRLMSDSLSDSSSGACRASTDWSVTPTL